MDKISFIIPGRNNLKYLEWAYRAIRLNLETQHEICFADDFSSDGTWEWCQEIMKDDPNFKAIRNEGPNRLGHTILYDKLINEVATSDIVLIYHCDMYAFKGIDEAILKNIKPKTVVSLTRIEPPLHPAGPEKLLMDWGIEPEQFDEDATKDFVEDFKKHYGDKITSGIFAPWAIYKKDFQAIGGHDPLFAPQSREDSDIFNRFVLAGYNLIQTWEGFVYHMTCRGSRFNPTITNVGTPSQEWLIQNNKSERNFIRKWGSMVRHDSNLMPIVPNRYNIVAEIKDLFTIDFIKYIEPLFDKIYFNLKDRSKNDYNSVYMLMTSVDDYIKEEQLNTKINLRDKFQFMTHESDTLSGNIIVSFDLSDMNQESFSILKDLSLMIQQTNSTGVFEIYKLKITINSLKEYQQNLIKLNHNQEDYIYIK